MPRFRPPPLLQLAAAQALMMSVSSLLLASSARIGLQLGSPGLATLPLALQSLATLLTLPLAARLGLRHGRAMLFLGGAGLGALGLGLAALALMLHSLGLFLVASGLLGVFIGVGQGYRFAAAERVAPPQAAPGWRPGAPGRICPFCMATGCCCPRCCCWAWPWGGWISSLPGAPLQPHRHGSARPTRWGLCCSWGLAAMA
ncbi:MAG: hypothetical protein ACRCTU_04790 [Zoogloea sp.]|uniref:hypothetical protein n=1 Tax=Zoogloea sp. TaxID=49181 RepID=UPI003F33EA5C